MRQEIKGTYQGMNQDVSKSKHQPQFYWEAKNLRIITNSDFGSVTPQKGNDLVMQVPDVSVSETSTITKDISGITLPATGLEILHAQEIDERVVLFTTNGNADCIFLLEEDGVGGYTTSLLYIDSFGWTTKTQIQSRALIESESVHKVYWVDGTSPIRFLNIFGDNLDKEPNEISTVPDATLLDPTVTGYASGGSHKSGMIQYAYNLYNKYGAQTRVSGLSPLVALYNDDKGNPFDADISKSPIVQIDDVPQNFDYIRVYSIYYSSRGTIPKISLIYENDNVSDTLTFTDTNDIIQEISLSEFNTISTQVIIPKNIETKDGHLFFANYKTEKFDVDFDARAYPFREISPTDYRVTLTHADSKYPAPIELTSINGATPLYELVPEDHDCIIADPTSLYKIDGNIGGSGPNVSYTVSYRYHDLDTPADNSAITSLKRGEKYRVGIVFYNSRGEESFVKWMSDVKVPGVGEDEYQEFTTGSLAYLAYIRVIISNFPADAVAWRIVRVERKDEDKTIKAQGLINPALLEMEPTGADGGTGGINYNSKQLHANYIQRTITDGGTTSYRTLDANTNATVPPASVATIRGEKFQRPIGMWTNESTSRAASIGVTSASPTSGELYKFDDSLPQVYQSNIHFNFYSPDVTMKKSKLGIDNTFTIGILGFVRNGETYSRADFYTAYNTAATALDDIDNRVSFTNTATDSTLYLYQIDAAADVTEGDTYVKNFFNITAPGGSYVMLGAPSRFTVTIDTEDANTWEFKKVFNKKKFTFYETDNTSTNIDCTIESGTDVIYTPPIINSILVGTKTGDPGNFFGAKIDKDLPFRLYTEFTGNTKMSSYGGSSIFFTSTDLFPNMFDYFTNDLTAGQRSTTDWGVMVEIKDATISQYGGNTYADRQRNKYISFSPKKTYQPGSPYIDAQYGDTFIQRTALLSMFENNQVVGDIECGITSVIEFICETSINNDMRYDTLKDELGTQTLDENSAYGYNSVYEQPNDLIKSIAKPFNFEAEETFTSEIVATPGKILGELIDNWTAISVNDSIILDTKHGGITAMTKMMDRLYAFQRNAVAYVSINPRVQLAASEGTPITLGSGDLLERYDYLSTVSGTLHERSITSTQNMIFYYDQLNASINRITTKEGNNELTTIKGLYNYLKNYTETNYDYLLSDIGLRSEAGFNNVLSHYDDKFEDVYFSFRTANESFTVAFNLLLDNFTSFYDFVPSIYFNLNNKMFTSNLDNNIWIHDAGDYSTFYNTYYPVSIKLLFNPEPDNDKIFNFIGFIQDTTGNSGDLPLTAMNKIRVTNAYQDTGLVDLTIGSNLRRKFREFYATIPRENGTRNRIRSPYAFVELQFDQTGEYNFTLYDLMVDYTIN